MGGGAFSFADLVLRGGFDLDVLGFGECGGSPPPSRKIPFLGDMKCFISPWKRREKEANLLLRGASEKPPKEERERERAVRARI